jgi:predicted outer membrane protein
MSASPKLRVGVVAAGLSCLLAAFVAAQNSNPNASGQPDRPATFQPDRSPAQPGTQTFGEAVRSRISNYRGAIAKAGGANQVVDHFLANCLLGQNKSEVQLSEIAQQKSENPQVKQFAQQMIQDHQKLIEQLQPLAGMQGETNRGVSGSLGTRTEERTTTTESAERKTDTTALPGSPGAERTIPPTGTSAAAPSLGTSGTTTDVAGSEAATDRAAGGGAIHQLMQIQRQIGERCTQAAREELQQKSGAEFDKCYVGSAIAAHMHALAELQVIGQQTQGQLAQVAQQAQPTVQQHLDQAKQLMKQLEGQTGATGSTAERKTSTRTE